MLPREPTLKTSGKNGILAITKGVSTGGQHYYTMGVDFENPTQLMEYPENADNPRLLPTSTGEITLGNKVGEIVIKSSKKTHPIYDNIIIGDSSKQEDLPDTFLTDSGINVFVAGRAQRDEEMAPFASNEDFGIKAIKGQGDDPRFLISFTKDGNTGNAQGYLTEDNVAHIDYVSSQPAEGNKVAFSSDQYKELKQVIKDQTGADSVSGFRISGSRTGQDPDIQFTQMKASGGIVDRPLYNR